MRTITSNLPSNNDPCAKEIADAPVIDGNDTSLSVPYPNPELMEFESSSKENTEPQVEDCVTGITKPVRSFLLVRQKNK